MSKHQPKSQKGSAEQRKPALNTSQPAEHAEKKLPAFEMHASRLEPNIDLFNSNSPALLPFIIAEIHAPPTILRPQDIDEAEIFIQVQAIFFKSFDVNRRPDHITPDDFARKFMSVVARRRVIDAKRHWWVVFRRHEALYNLLARVTEADPASANTYSRTRLALARAYRSLPKKDRLLLWCAKRRHVAYSELLKHTLMGSMVKTVNQAKVRVHRLQKRLFGAYVSHFRQL